VDHLHSYGIVQPQVESRSWIFYEFLTSPFSVTSVSFLVVSALPLFFVEGPGVIFFDISTRSGALTVGFQDFMTPL
jgi:hypothetical protein